jgi:hypothetical protein
VGLLPLMDLELWGAPTSKPARDPHDPNFIYQRFQRGIMHYDKGCSCTQGLLLADYFKALLVGQDGSAWLGDLDGRLQHPATCRERDHVLLDAAGVGRTAGGLQG